MPQYTPEQSQMIRRIAFDILQSGARRRAERQGNSKTIPDSGVSSEDAVVTEEISDAIGCDNASGGELGV